MFLSQSSTEYNWDDILLSSFRYCLKLQLMLQMRHVTSWMLCLLYPHFEAMQGHSYDMCEEKPIGNIIPGELHFLYYGHNFTFDDT